MTILKRIEDAKKLWELLLPHIEKPADAVFAKWTRFSDSAIEAGIVRGSKKFAARKVNNSILDTSDVYKYIAGVIRNEAEAQKETSGALRNEVENCSILESAQIIL